MSIYASIDIKAMSGLVSAADSAATELGYDEWGFDSILNPVDVDPSPADRLGKVAAWLTGQVPGLKRRLALAQANEAQGRAFQGVVRIDETKLSTLDPTAAENLGATDAKKLRDGGGKLDPTLVAEIAKYQNDPYFAHGFATTLTPAEMAEIVQESSNQLFQHRFDNDHGTYLTNYQQVLSAMGSTMATATRSTDPQLQLPGSTAQAWLDTFRREPGDKDFVPNQAAALGLLLRYGSYGSQFLGTVSDGVYNYERSKNGDPVWGPKAGNIDPIYDPSGTGVATDVMPDVLTALGHNADAAQAFFDVGNPNASTVSIKIDGKTYQVDKRLEYLIAERTWSTDRFSDDGHGLGLALDAATTFYRNNGPTGAISAEIASQTLAIIGGKTGAGEDHRFWIIPDSPGWKMWDGMRPSVAHIVASYAPDLMRVASQGSDDFGSGWTQPSGQFFPPNGPIGATLDQGLMAKILGTLGEDPKNIDIVTTGVGVNGGLRLRYALQQAMQGDPNAPVDLITGKTLPGAVGASNEIAATMSFILNNAFQGDKNNQDFQKKQAEKLSEAMGIVLAAPTFAVPESAPWTGFLVETAEDAALKAVGEGPDANAQSTYNDQASNTQTNLEQAFLNDVLASGYLDPKYFSKAGPLYQPPPDSAFKKDSHGQTIEPKQFDFDSQGYKDWARSGQNLQEFLNTNVITPFRAQFPALGASS